MSTRVVPLTLTPAVAAWVDVSVITVPMALVAVAVALRVAVTPMFSLLMVAARLASVSVW